MAIAVAVAGTGYSVLAGPLTAHQARSQTAAAAQPRAATAATTPSAQAAAAAAQLQHWYNGRSYTGARWWQSAIALSAVVRYMTATGSRAYVGDLAATYRAFHKTNDFTRNYYDDMGWWALTWAQAYGLTGDRRYLGEAEHIFAAMTEGWDGVCGGGLPWSKIGHYYKNAITNELFLDVAATLHNLVPGDAAYARWALREWAWFRSSGLITRSHLVVDGLDRCKPVLTSPTWTYNQGVLIGGLVELSRIPGSGRPLRAAKAVAAAVMTSRELSPDGILQEPCEPDGCGRDGVIFKGVFAQNLGLLADRAPSAAFAAYLRRNAEAVWDTDRQGEEFGLRWAGPFDIAGSARQVSALAILTARAATRA